MRTIGIRVKPREIVFTVYDSATNSLVTVESVKLPKALSVPESLKHARNSILDILREFKIERAGIRITESTSQQLSIERIQIEGVVQEAFASSNLDSYYCGQIASISSRIELPRADFKRVVEGTLAFNRVGNWSALGKEEREAVLAALGALA